MRKLLDALMELLYPHAANCLCCEETRFVSDEDCLCSACRERIKGMRIPASSCNRCLMPVKAGRPCSFCSRRVMENIDAVYSPFRYGSEVRKLIHQFKFGACNEALATLAPYMAKSLAGKDFDALVPVPLHKWRLLERGVNQARLLADALSERTGIPVEEPLERTVYRTAQSRLKDQQRRGGNVHGVFRCDGNVRDKRVLLVDDVRTTGSTASECARVLKEAGAAAVSLCVCAVVYRSDDGKSSAEPKSIKGSLHASEGRT